jgi:hypothetical protein
MSRKYSTVVGLAAGAAAAAFVGMGTAHADTPIYVDTYADSSGVAGAGDTTLPNDAYDMLFGAMGTTANTQGFENNALDVSDAQTNLTGYEGFATDVATFEDTAGDHGLENLVFALDPSAFYEQTTEGITGYISGTDAYLVPDSALGYLATGLDYGLLSPTGLDYVLTPLIDVLLGQPV